MNNPIKILKLNPEHNFIVMFKRLSYYGVSFSLQEYSSGEIRVRAYKSLSSLNKILIVGIKLTGLDLDIRYSEEKEFYFLIDKLICCLQAVERHLLLSSSSNGFSEEYLNNFFSLKRYKKVISLLLS